MKVDFYCNITAPGVELHEQKEFVQDWLSDVKSTIQEILNRFLIDGGDLFPSLITSDPPYQATYTFDEVWSLNLYFYFELNSLELLYNRIELLKSLFVNLAYGNGILPSFEYHLAD